MGEPKAEDRDLTALALVLLFAAIAMWVFSLFLTAFDASRESYSGLEACLIGLFFGWMAAGGWAAYANVAFWLVVRRMFSGSDVGLLVVVMCLLVATLPLLTSIPADEGGGTLPVAGWGWGAVVWITSMVLLACAAAVREGLFGRVHVIVVLALIGLSAAALMVVHDKQWKAANRQERVMDLAPGIALSREEFCGIELTWPAGQVVPDGARVALDAPDQAMDARSPYLNLWLPTLPRLRADGALWEESSGLSDPFEARLTGESDFILSMKTTEEGGLIRLVDRQRNIAVYEQRLRIRRSLRGWPEFCPLATTFLSPHPKAPGYDDALLVALGSAARGSLPGTKILREEVASETCNPSPEPIPEIQGGRMWDGRAVILHGETANSLGRCSEHYAVLVRTMCGVRTGNKAYAEVSVHDRATLRAVRGFTGYQEVEAATCLALEESEIRAVRLQPTTIVVETSVMDLPLAHR